jgi:hypothetical protein
MRQLRGFAAAICLAALASPSSASPTSFNLTCAGSLSVQSPWDIREEPYRTVYRVNLGLGKWCEDDCRRQYNIEKTTATSLTLRKTDDGAFYHSNSVDRQTGEQVAMMHSEMPSGSATAKFYWLWTGKCERSEFTGFPPFKRQF